MKRQVLGLALMALALAPVGASGATLLRGGVMGNGGDPAAGGGYVMQGTLGQAATGMSFGAAARVCSGYWCFGGVRVLAVDGPPGDGPPAGGGALPHELSFGPCFPNPTRGQASFNLALPQAGHARLTVYDVAGRQVGEPFDRELPAGWHRVWWNVPGGRAGVFFATLTVDGRTVGQRRVVAVH
jgi:hypothetical protein